jgi:hypothetical protein
MGLDMYLMDRHKDEELFYWRKANQIHGWFVNNVQGGVDDCGTYPVSREQLSSLVKVCREAISSKNPHLVPPKTGFFFGSYAIDEGYWDDLKSTVVALEEILSESGSGGDVDGGGEDDGKAIFHYHASW